MKRWFNIQIDLSEILDRYSILEIKIKNCIDGAVKIQLWSQLKELENKIIKGIGFKLFQQIIKSEEYNNLFEANDNVFRGVSRAETDLTYSAYELNKLNKTRTIAKKRISMKFLGDEGEEIKINSEGKRDLF